MSETPNLLLPFPVDTDKIAKGALNIEELAEQIEADILINALSATDSYKTYPKGVSVMASGNAGWPYSTGLVITFKIKAGSFATQLFAWRTSVTTRQQLLVRYGWSDSNAADHWSGWQQITSQGAQVVATGAVTVPGKTTDFASVTVTFPSGLFSNVPAVVTDIRGSVPNIGHCVANVTATKFDILVDRPSGADTYCYWVAASNYVSGG